MTTYYIEGNPPNPFSFRITSDGVPPVNIIVTLGDPTFMDMNAWDCCKDAGPHDAGAAKMNQFLPNLFHNAPGGALWTNNWHTNLENNFKTHITNNNIEEEEIVFERNKIEVTKLDQYFFSNESGLGGLRVAFDKTKIFEIDTGAQHVDEGPGTGNPNYSFPKPGDTLIFTKSFFEFLGFPNIISQWECTTNAMGLGTDKYTYKITLTDGTTIDDANKIRVSNPDKNTHISNDTCPIPCEVLILLKELGDVMQTATYLVFIKLAEDLQRQLKAAATTGVQPTQQELQSLLPLPIAINDPFYQCLQSKNINYSAIMLTCDNTVHNRNIKLGIPSCVTSSHKEVPYDHATQTGRIYLPKTDPVEKLKSLLNMEYKRIEVNNTTIIIRLTKAYTTKKLVYIRQGLRGKEIETKIPNNFNTTEIRIYIDGLTQQAKVAEQKILAFITQNGQLLDTPQTYEYVKNVILGIPNPAIVGIPNPAIVELQVINGFSEFMCPPIVTPVPPNQNPTDPQASIDRKCMKLSLVSLQIPSVNAHHADLLGIITSELTNVGVNVTTMQGGGKSKQRGGTKEFEYKKPIKLVTKFSASEKFLIFILSNFCRQVTDPMMEHIFSMYNTCIYMLEYYKNIKNIKFNNLNISLNISDPKYAYFRLYRVLSILAETFSYDKTELDRAIAAALPEGWVEAGLAEGWVEAEVEGEAAEGEAVEAEMVEAGLAEGWVEARRPAAPAAAAAVEAEVEMVEAGIDPEQSERLTLEKIIDMHLSNDVLAYFYVMFNFIDADDRVLPESDADIWDQCMHQTDALTLQRIEGSGIYDPIKKHCIATASIINWLNQTYRKGISRLPDSAFIDPYSRLQYKQNVINHIKREYKTSLRQHVTTRNSKRDLDDDNTSEDETGKRQYVTPPDHRGGKYSYLSKQFTTNKNKMHNKKLATKTRKHKSQKQKNQRKHKSRKHKSQKQKNQRKHKSRKHKSRMPKQDKAL